MKKKKARAVSLRIIENTVSAMFRELLVYILHRMMKGVNLMSLSCITDCVWLVIAILVLVQWVIGFAEWRKTKRKKKKKKRKKKLKGGIIKNAYTLKIDKPRGYQLNSADNKKALESKVGLYSVRSK